MVTLLQELYRCSNGGWVALSAFAVYSSFKMPVRLSTLIQCVIQLIHLQRKGVNEALDDLFAFSHKSPNAGILDSVRARHFMEPDVILETLP